MSAALIAWAALAPRCALAQSGLEHLAGQRVLSISVADSPQLALPPLATRPGAPFDPRVFDEDLKRLAAAGEFLQVRPIILCPEQGGGVDIVLDVVDLRTQRPAPPANVRAQSPDPWKLPPPIEEVPPPDAEAGQPVVEVRVDGNDVIPRQKIQALIRTRVERPFDRETMNDDVRRLVQSRMFLDVKARAEQSPDGGVVVTFTVVERPLLKEVKFLGNSKIKASALAKEADLKIGSPLDPYTVDDAKQRLEALYDKKGINNTRIEVLEGDRPGDRRVVFLINEGVKQRIKWVTFEGNTIASDARLRTQIQSKPPILWIFKGYVDRKQIEADVDKLTAYYRSLGYFSARIGRELEWNEDESWLTLRFVIDEGPRYKIRNISITGNLKFPREELEKDLQLKPGDYFDQPKMNADVVSIQDVYGSQGYIFANVQPDPRFLEEPGQLDLIYNIEEGKRYRVGRIDVRITGEHPHTRIRTVLNRMSLRPGDIVDTRELRASERRLKASQLFNVDPARGVSPKIVLIPQDEADGSYASRNRRQSSRGQSPDPAPPAPFAPPAAGHRPPPMPQPVQPQSPPLMPPRVEWPQNVPPPAPAQEPIFRGQSPDNRPARLSWRPTRPAQQEPIVETKTEPVRPAWPSAQRRYAPAPHSSAYSAPQVPSVIRGQSPSLAPPPSSGPPVYVAPPAGAPMQFGGPPPQPGLGPSLAPGQVEQILPPPMDGQLFPPQEPDEFVILQPTVEEARTGRLMFGIGVNSDAGLVGNVVLEEQNFDIMRWPSSWYELWEGSGFRGAGQRLRIEAVPGTQVQRYMFNFSEPYLFDTPVSFGVSGFIYDRRFRDWTESRYGGQLSLGYQITPDLSFTASQRAENVELRDPRFPTPPEVAEVVGDTDLYKARFALAHDTRDNVFLPTEGHLIELAYEQAYGEYEYPRGTLDVRQFFLIRQRPDGSGRHVLGLSATVGVSGSNTPVMEHFFAGGTTTLRGFRFRGASPSVLGTVVGGEFEFLGSVEYLAPITADDALRAVFFCDFGTVAETIDEIEADDFRVAPGFGLRITVPALGPAPIALDLAFPVAHADGDEIQNFSFRVGLFR